MKKIFKQFIPYFKSYKKHIVLNVIFNILYSLFGTLSYVSIIPMLGILFDKTQRVSKLPEWTGLEGVFHYLKDYFYYKLTTLLDSGEARIALLMVVCLVIFTFLLKNLFGFFAQQHMMFLRNGVLAKLRKELYDKIIYLPISFYSKNKKGDIMARILGDIGEMQNSLFIVLELIVKEPLNILFALIAMIVISWKLTLFVVVFIPISGFIISKIGKSLKSKSLRAQRESGELISTVEETLSGLKIIKSYNSEDNFRERFSKSVDKLLKLANSIGKRNNLAGPISETLGIITIAILLWYGGSLVLIETNANGEPLLEGTVFISFMLLAYGILTPAKSISKASYKVKNGLAAADRVFEILDEENSMLVENETTTLNDFNSEVELKNISFKYENDYVLNNFSATVPKGKTIALVGQSGSGKSTIANLVTRFYDVNEGAICVDGHDIKNVTKKSLRQLLGLVTQDSILFNDSIKNNILLGKPEATEEEIIDALKIANAWEFVKELPQGINTNVGDAGNNFSGGQKQRLSIARAVLKNPPIMVLDEATSALDTESERLVQDALENMMKNRTSIVIAHRLSTIQNADLIIVMYKGEIAEQGSHLELLAKNGVYKKLVDMQSFEEL